MKKIITSLSLLSALSMSMLCFGMNEDGSKRGLPKAFFQAIKPMLFEIIKGVKEGANDNDKKTYREYFKERLANAEKSLANNDADAEYLLLIGEGQTSYGSGRCGKPPSGVRAQYAGAIDHAIMGVRYMKLGCYPENAVGFDFEKECGLAKVSSEEYEKTTSERSKELNWSALHVEASRDLAQILLKELGEENK